MPVAVTSFLCESVHVRVCVYVIEPVLFSNLENGWFFESAYLKLDFLCAYTIVE